MHSIQRNTQGSTLELQAVPQSADYSAGQMHLYSKANVGGLQSPKSRAEGAKARLVAFAQWKAGERAREKIKERDKSGRESESKINGEIKRVRWEGGGWGMWGGGGGG